MISNNSLCSSLKNNDDIEIVKILRNETHFSLGKGVLIPRHSLWKPRKIMLKVEVIELADDSWSWNAKLMSNIGHRSFFNQLLSNFLVDNTRDLVILLDERSLSDHHFQAMIASKTALFQENSSRHTSRFKVRNLRRFLKVIFLHLMSTIRTRWSIIIQLSDDFLMGIPIDDIYNLDIWVFDI